LSTKRPPSAVRGLLALGGGSAGGYALTLALSPILTRLYSPELFGLFGVFSAIVAIFSIFATLSLELGILGADRRSESLRFATGGLAAALFATAIALPAAIFIGGSAPFGQLPIWAVCAALAVCLTTVLQLTATNWAIRTDRNNRAARATFAGLAGRSLLQVGFGFWFGGLGGLIAGEWLGRVAGWLTAEAGTARAALRRITSAPRRIVAHLSRNRRYPFYVTPAVSIEVALVWLPAPFFAIAYGPDVGGFVALIQRLGSAPLTIVNQSLGQLVHRHAGDMIRVNPRRVLTLTSGLVLATLPLLAVLMAVLWFYGEQIAGAVFGTAWRQAGLVALIFAPLYYVQFLSLVTNRLILVLDRMRLKLAASGLHLVVLVASLPAARLAGLDWLGAMALLVTLLTLSYAAVFAFVLWLVDARRRSVHP